MGGEGKGLRPLVRQHCDVVVSLPMPGAIESLNAAVAGSIVLYEALRQRSEQSAVESGDAGSVGAGGASLDEGGLAPPAE